MLGLGTLEFSVLLITGALGALGFLFFSFFLGGVGLKGWRVGFTCSRICSRGFGDCIFI